MELLSRFGAASKQLGRVVSRAARDRLALPNRALEQEVADRRASERTLLASEARLRSFVEHLPVGIIVYSPTCELVSCNHAASVLFGLAPEEVRGVAPWSGPWERLRDDGTTLLEGEGPVFEAASTGLPVHDFLIGLKTQARSELTWVEVTAVPQFDAEGTFTSILTICKDVTERRRIDMALRRAQRALAAITASNQAIVRAVTEEEVLAQVCEAIVTAGGYPLAWVGYTRDDDGLIELVVRAGSAAVALDAQRKALVDGPWGTAIRGGVPYVARHLVDDLPVDPERQAALELGFAATMALPLKVGEGVVGVLCIHSPDLDAFSGEEQRLLERLADDLSHGITVQRASVEHERVITALRTSEAQFRASFEQVAVGMLRATEDGQILEANDRLCEILGYRREELVRMRWQDLTHPDDLPESQDWLAQLASRRHTSSVLEKRYLRKDGTTLWGLVSVATVREPDGRVLFRIAAVQDITPHKQAQMALATSEARFRAVFEQAGVGIAVSDDTGVWHAVNARQGELLGYEAHELVGHHAREFMHPEDQTADAVVDQQVREGVYPPLEVESRYVHRSGRTVWMQVSVGTIHDDSNTYQGTMAIFQDITARKQAEEAVRQAAAENALLAAAVEHTSVGVIVSQIRGAAYPILYVNQAFLQITGYEEAEVLGSNPHFLRDISSNPLTRQAMRDATAAGRAFTSTLRIPRKDGTAIWVDLRTTPIHDAQGQLCNFVGLVTDVSEQVRMHTELEHLAVHDQLTGLPNRTLLLDRATQEILRADSQGMHAALLLLDLDQFKEVNDTFGHAVGDDLLRRVAEALGGAVRATATVARLGGDEFAVLLPETDADTAVETARAVQRMLSEPLVIDGRQLRATASIGIALYPEHGEDAAALLQHADVAMYQAKRARHPAMLYAPEQDKHTPDRAALTEDVRTAISRGQLRLHYQPLVDLSTGQVTSVEALVRWQHPVRGLLYPDTFMPLLENLGLMANLTRWVVAEGMRQRRAWHDQGLDLVMNVNLAASDLQDEDLLAGIVQALTSSGRPERLCLELTEGALVGDLEHTRAALHRLAAAGVQIAIDDYGTGYSSLSRLARLPVDELKIDRLFVQAMLANAVDAAIVASTVELAHSLGVPVVAEGVEDEATLTHLRELGCDRVQGYFYSRPVSAEDLVRWLEGRQKHT